MFRSQRCMRAADQSQSAMFSYLSPEIRVRREHALPAIRMMVDRALGEMSPLFNLLTRSIRRLERPRLPCSSNTQTRIYGVRKGATETRSPEQSRSKHTEPSRSAPHLRLSVRMSERSIFLLLEFASGVQFADTRSGRSAQFVCCTCGSFPSRIPLLAKAAAPLVREAET